jgi:hypothetical protein
MIIYRNKKDFILQITNYFLFFQQNPFIKNFVHHIFLYVTP